MEFDDVTQTGDLPVPDAPEAMQPRREPLPWVLLAVVVAVALVAIVLLWVRVGSEAARADEAALSQARAEADLAGKATQLEDLEKRTGELETQVKALEAQRDGLLGQVKALEAKAAVAATAEPTKPAVKAPAKKSKKKSTKRKRR
ncbi:MAG: hypothetical protein AB1730_04150 [Myxococcota bacterium]|jgi:uncharacterized protein HemX